MEEAENMSEGFLRSSIVASGVGNKVIEYRQKSFDGLLLNGWIWLTIRFGGWFEEAV